MSYNTVVTLANGSAMVEPVMGNTEALNYVLTAMLLGVSLLAMFYYYWQIGGRR